MKKQFQNTHLRVVTVNPSTQIQISIVYVIMAAPTRRGGNREDDDAGLGGSPSSFRWRYTRAILCIITGYAFLCVWLPNISLLKMNDYSVTDEGVRIVWKSQDVVLYAQPSQLSSSSPSIHRNQVVGAPTNLPTLSLTTSISTALTTEPRVEIRDDLESITPLQCPSDACSDCAPNGIPNIPGVHIQDGHTMYKSYTFVSDNWGNVLSPYWAARAMAALGGYHYKGNQFGIGSWMEFLPTAAPAPRELQQDIFEHVCRKCRNYEYFHHGLCSEGWAHIAPVVMKDTQMAILEHSKRTPQEDTDAIFKFFHPDDWLVYNRCTIFQHPEHSPGILRTYDAIPTKGAFHVYIMMGRREDRYSFCNILVEESIEYMKSRNPSINITILEASSKYVDYARLVFAPNILVASMGSSWALWSAVLANSNNVVSLIPTPDADVPSLPKSVKFLVDVPTLLDPEHFESAAEVYRVPLGEFPNTTEARNAVLRFYRGEKYIVSKDPKPFERLVPHKNCRQEQWSVPEGLGRLYDISLFYHIGMIGNWRDIVDEQLSILEECGLGSLAKTMTIAYNTKPADLQHHRNPTEMINDILRVYKFSSQMNVSFIDASSSNPFERVSMEEISVFCDKATSENPGKTNIIFYFHNKGSSKYVEPGQPEYENYLNVYYWRRYMEYFLMERPSLCSRAILHHGTMTCGVNLQLNPKRHYSGNFWAASCTHINDLPVGNSWVKGDGSFDPYISAELWIGNYTVRKQEDELKYLTLFNVGADLYTFRALPDSYSFVVDEKTFLQNNQSSSYVGGWSYQCYDPGNQTDIWLDYLSGLVRNKGS